MEIKLSAHSAYRHQYHVVWIPKYRRRVLKRGVKTYVERGLCEIDRYHPDVLIQQYNVREDHVHVVIEIPPKYAVASIIGKLKQNSSRKIRERFEWLDKVYERGVFWSPGYFSSTIGLNEEQIRKYVEFQEKADKGGHQLNLF
jgi:putative transposase